MSGSEPERPQFLFVKALASRGRLEAVTQQMGYHPRYLDSFLKTQHYLLHMDGPLPFDCRHYIAIMVSPRRSRPGAPRAAGFPAEAKAGWPRGEVDAQGPRWLLPTRG